jgi:hypothetical protein
MTAEQRQHFIGALLFGGTKADAYGAVGVSRSTVRRAMAADPGFASAVKSADVRGKLNLVMTIHNAAMSGGQWRAAAWLLERRFPNEFGRRCPDDYRREEVEDLVTALAETALRFVAEERREEFAVAVRAVVGEARRRRRCRRWVPRGKG